MGLDMNLHAEKYIGHTEATEKHLFNAIVDMAGMRKLVNEEAPVLRLSMNVAYWRKANAIHGWFVRHVQGGKDECQRSYVSHEQLKELHDLAVVALNEYEKGNFTDCAAILPPRKGFFFGTYEIDQWYAEDLKNTIKQLVPLITDDMAKEYEFHYQASW